MSEAGIMNVESNIELNSSAGQTEVTKAEKNAHPFLDDLRDELVAQAKSALVKTLCKNSNRSIGEIIDVLEQDPDGDYVMIDSFKALTIVELVTFAAPAILGTPNANKSTAKAKAPVTGASNPSGDDEEYEYEEEDNEFDENEDYELDSLDDSDDYQDDGSEEEEEVQVAKRKPKNKKKKTAKAKNKTTDGEMDLKTAKKKILQCLRKNGANNKKSAMSSSEVRAITGGSPELIRAGFIELYDEDQVDKHGKARGTRYFLA